VCTGCGLTPDVYYPVVTTGWQASRTLLGTDLMTSWRATSSFWGPTSVPRTATTVPWTMPWLQFSWIVRELHHDLNQVSFTMQQFAVVTPSSSKAWVLQIVLSLVCGCLQTPSTSACHSFCGSIRCQGEHRSTRCTQLTKSTTCRSMRTSICLQALQTGGSSNKCGGASQLPGTSSETSAGVVPQILGMAPV
jgi:hypothetical protein